MGTKICLVLHRKSANRPEIKEAVKAVRAKGIKLRVRIPWNKKDKPRVVEETLAGGVKRVIAGGDDGTINAGVNALVGRGKKPPKASSASCRSARRTTSPMDSGCPLRIWLPAWSSPVRARPERSTSAAPTSAASST